MEDVLGVFGFATISLGGAEEVSFMAFDDGAKGVGVTGNEAFDKLRVTHLARPLRRSQHGHRNPLLVLGRTPHPTCTQLLAALMLSATSLRPP
ncbi:hypothetical protein [Corynebacterium deserti]|uniref:hypothetical protein n=1 Tax=Corynebacterium deserti TaxID=1408191 RepID=UPI001E31EF15|nr:hypothetical protein [Corynebacterium deserti]